MKHLLKASFLALGLSISAFSAETVSTPNASGSNPLMDYAGVSTCRIDASTGTTAAACTLNAALVYGIAFASMAANDRVVLYSTNSLTLVGATPKKNAVATTAVVTNELTFVKPILFPLGLVAKATNAPTAGGASEIVIYYREAK